MRHYRQPPQKSFLAYIIPFLILILIGGIFFFLVRFWDNIDAKFNTETSYAIMETEVGEAKVMLWGTTDWKSVPTSKIKLFKGDSIRSLPGSKVKVVLFDKHNFVLNGNSEILIQELRKDKQTLHTALEVVEGEIWFDIERDINPNSTFLVNTPDLKVSTEGAVFDLEKSAVRVLKGSVQTQILVDGTFQKPVEIGVGQELLLTDKKREALALEDQNLELLTMLSDEFKLSSWYLYNTEGVQLPEASSSGIALENDSTDTGVSLIEKTEETKTSLEDSETEEVLVLEKPIVTSPAKSGEKFEVKTDVQSIEGTVKKGTAQVVVNNYTLQSFKLGDTNWKYTASVQFENLKEGENVYEIYAVDSKGKKSSPAQITLVYKKDTKTEVKKEETDTEVTSVTETEVTSTTATGEGLKITEPNNGADFTTEETSFVISGTAPKGAAKIVVSGYTLTGFTEGNATWRYTADPKYNNLNVGEANTYKVVAYDAEGNLLDSASLTITVEGTAATGTGIVTD